MEGQIDGECANEEVVAAIVAADANFVAEKRAIYEAVRTQVAARQEAAAASSGGTGTGNRE